MHELLGIRTGNRKLPSLYHFTVGDLWPEALAHHLQMMPTLQTQTTCDIPCNRTPSSAAVPSEGLLLASSAQQEDDSRKSVASAAKAEDTSTQILAEFVDAETQRRATRRR